MNKIAAKTYPHIRKPYDRLFVEAVQEGESLTQVCHGNETDVNAIVERFQRTGKLPEHRQEPQYGDCTELQTDLTLAYNTAMHHIETFNDFAEQYQPATEPEPPAPPEPVIPEPPNP